MLPIGMAIISQLKDNPETKEDENATFGKALMLAIAYSASIGGIATLIGTPPNLIFAGILEESYNIDASKIKDAITNKTKAIMPVSLYGQCADMNAINEIARKFDIPVIEDACQSFGATYK